MITVVRWTGHEVRLLREVLRMSLRTFAVHAQLSMSRLAEIEAQGEQARLRPATQRLLDSVLAGASEQARRRLAALLPPAPTPPGHVSLAGRQDAAKDSARSGTAVARIGLDTAWPGECDTDRRAALTAALGLASAAVTGVPSAGPDHGGYGFGAVASGAASGVNTQGGAYGELAERLWRLYWTAPAGSLFETATAHVRLGGDLLRGASGVERSGLLSGLARSALLAARLAFFDLDRPQAADGWHRAALAAADESGDDLAAAVVLGHMAFAPAFAGDAAAATALVTAALPQARRVGPVVRSWLHCVASEAHARAGDGLEALRQIESADAAYRADGPLPEWFDFYDQARLHCFAGYAAMAAGEPVVAVGRLSLAADALGDDGAKQRSVVCADLAAACASDADLAAAYLHRAMDALETSWYGTGWQRVRETRALLGDSRLAHTLDQRLAVLGGAARSYG